MTNPTTLGQMVDTLLPIGKSLVAKIKESLEIEPEGTPHPRPKPAATPERGEWSDAGITVFWAWQAYDSARTASEQARAYNDLSNALSDLFTWLPGWDYETSTIKEQ